MKRRALAVCASMLLLGLVPGSALAVVAPNPVALTDQSQEVTTKDWNGPGTFAQTLKVGQAGGLDGVDLYLISVPASATVDVKIETLDRNTKLPLLPANVRAQGSIKVDADKVGKWYHLDFTPFDVLVGAQLAIVFTLNSADASAAG